MRVCLCVSVCEGGEWGAVMLTHCTVPLHTSESLECVSQILTVKPAAFHVHSCTHCKCMSGLELILAVLSVTSCNLLFLVSYEFLDINVFDSENNDRK